MSFSYQISGGSYVSSYGASGLPPGLSVNNSSGAIYGTPTTAGTYNSSIYAYNGSGSGSGSLTITINQPQAPAIIVQPISDSPIGFRAISSGYNSTMGLRQDGEVWNWGNDGNGQLGDNLTTTRLPGAPAPGVQGAVSISSGYNFSLVATGAGAVWTYGYNNYGQLGDGTTTGRHVPVQVSGLSHVTQVSAGYSHALALKSDGTVWAWGYNGYGQLGDGTTTNRVSPVQVQGLTNVTSIDCGYYHNLALKSDGTVWAWGTNGNGQLGDGTSTSRYTPVQVAGLSGIVAISAGQGQSLAVKSDGTAWAWGYNGYGQLGNGSTSSYYSPVQVSGITGVVQVAAGDYHSVALKSDGTVWAWGYNAWMQLGDGTSTQRYTPVQVQNLSGVVAISASTYRTAAVKSDGTIREWGLNEPQSTYYYPGNSITWTPDVVFTVSATGVPAPTYQWQRKPAGGSSFTNLTDGSAYSGSTTALLRVIAPTSAMNGDQFQCVLSNNAGQVVSSAGSLVIGPPSVTILGGNNQNALPSSFATQALDVAIWNPAGTQPLVGAPVTFAVTAGGGLLATTAIGSPALSSSLSLTTDVNGTAQAYYKEPSSAGVTSQVTATSGSASVAFSTQTVSNLTPPSAPGWVQASSSTPTSIGFSWAAVTPTQGGAAISGYYIYRNGTQLNGSPQLSTSFTDTGVSGGTAYTYTVKAVDSAGNLSTAATLSVAAPTSSTSGSFDVYTPTL